MEITVKKSIPKGIISAPPSKSIAHRALILGAFSKSSIIENIEFSEDIKATIGCLKALGANVVCEKNYVKIGGLNLNNIKDNVVLFANESGSTLRFLIPVCLLSGKKITFKGTKKLISRPLDEYEKICKENGFLFEIGEDFVTVCGNPEINKISVSAQISSQFVTGFLLAFSLFSGEKTVEIKGEIGSKPYIDITLDVLNFFGVNTDFDGKTVKISGGKIKNTKYFVEADASNGAYLCGFDFLGEVGIENLNTETKQGDIEFLNMFEELRQGKREFNLKNHPDLAPLMFVLCCFFGKCEFIGTNRLKYKESDRVLAMKEELNKFNVELKDFGDRVIIDPSKINAPSVKLSSHNDHRIVMALCILCAKFGGEIENCEAVNKSFPDYFCKLREIGVEFSPNS
ncbi:MAG: hypothetical protein MJ080_02545 [Clostridia bacterium]|nr:hypothetical protein [Clostridia bacterium]